MTSSSHLIASHRIASHLIASRADCKEIYFEQEEPAHAGLTYVDASENPVGPVSLDAVQVRNLQQRTGSV